MYRYWLLGNSDIVHATHKANSVDLPEPGGTLIKRLGTCRRFVSVSSFAIVMKCDSLQAGLLIANSRPVTSGKKIWQNLMNDPHISARTSSGFISELVIPGMFFI